MTIIVVFKTILLALFVLCDAMHRVHCTVARCLKVAAHIHLFVTVQYCVQTAKTF